MVFRVLRAFFALFPGSFRVTSLAAPQVDYDEVSRAGQHWRECAARVGTEKEEPAGPACKGDAGAPGSAAGVSVTEGCTGVLDSSW